MDTHKMLLRSIVAGPKIMTITEFEKNFNKLSYLTKENYNFVDEFKFNYYKEVFKVAVEHGLDKLIELGFSESELYSVFANLNRNYDFKISKEEQSKLMNDCDEIANWIRENITTVASNEVLQHDAYHCLHTLYLTIKAMKTKD